MGLFNCTHSKQVKQQQQGNILEKNYLAQLRCQIASDQNLRLSCQVYKMFVWIKVSTYVLVSFQMVLRHIILNPFSFSSFAFETYQFLFDS